MMITQIYARGGKFEFSDEFINEYIRRIGRFPYIWTKPHEEAQSDPIAIAILNDFGTEWSSGPRSSLGIITYPEILKLGITFNPYHDKYVHINVELMTTHALETCMSEGYDMVWLDDKNKEIEDALNSVRDNEDIYIS